MTMWEMYSYVLSSRRIAFDHRSPGNTTQVTLAQSRSPELRSKQIRQDSISSDMSALTTDNDGNLENEWVVWNKIIHQWAVYIKKKPQWIKVTVSFALKGRR